MAYVSEDGNFGSDEAVIFHNDSLTDEEWEQLDWLGDSERYQFVMNILQKKGHKWIGRA